MQRRAEEADPKSQALAIIEELVPFFSNVASLYQHLRTNRAERVVVSPTPADP